MVYIHSLQQLQQEAGKFPKDRKQGFCSQGDSNTLDCIDLGVGFQVDKNSQGYYRMNKLKNRKIVFVNNFARMVTGIQILLRISLHVLKELCHGIFIYFSDLTKLFSH